MNMMPTNINVAQARLPARYEQAKVALSSCANIDECKDWADKAQALASYAKQANDDELLKMSTRIRDRAIRRAGELLKQIEPARGANQNIGGGTSPKVITRKEAAADAGLSPDQAKMAMRIANVPAESFEAQVESANPPTASKLAAQGKRPAPQPVIDLKGRNPQEFNRSLHFIAEVQEYADVISQTDLDLILPGLTPDEADKVRIAIAKIDATHDRIVTRI
jgi:hypothetical protein